jgi:hypothetical protein
MFSNRASIEMTPNIAKVAENTRRYSSTPRPRIRGALLLTIVSKPSQSSASAPETAV